MKRGLYAIVLVTCLAIIPEGAYGWRINSSITREDGITNESAKRGIRRLTQPDTHIPTQQERDRAKGIAEKIIDFSTGSDWGTKAGEYIDRRNKEEGFYNRRR